MSIGTGVKAKWHDLDMYWSNPQWNWNANVSIVVFRLYVSIITDFVFVYMYIYSAIQHEEGICTNSKTHCNIITETHWNRRIFSANAENYPKYSRETVCTHFIGNEAKVVAAAVAAESSNGNSARMILGVLYICRNIVNGAANPMPKYLYAILLSWHFWVSKIA